MKRIATALATGMVALLIGVGMASSAAAEEEPTYPAPPPSEEPTTTTSPSAVPAQQVSQPAAAEDSLPFTGGDVLGLGVIAVGVTGAGAAAVYTARRRKNRDD